MDAAPINISNIFFPGSVFDAEFNDFVLKTCYNFNSGMQRDTIYSLSILREGMLGLYFSNYFFTVYNIIVP